MGKIIERTAETLYYKVQFSEKLLDQVFLDITMIQQDKDQNTPNIEHKYRYQFSKMFVARADQHVHECKWILDSPILLMKLLMSLFTTVLVRILISENC